MKVIRGLAFTQNAISHAAPHSSNGNEMVLLYLNTERIAIVGNRCTSRSNSDVLDCLEVEQNSPWGVTNGEVLPLDQPLEVAGPGHLEIVEKTSHENCHLCVRKTAQHTCQHNLVLL